MLFFGEEGVQREEESDRFDERERILLRPFIAAVGGRDASIMGPDASNSQ
jgi:hypothetical protein